MKTISYFTFDELKSIPSCIISFFTGENGFFKKEAHISGWFPGNTSELIRITEALEDTRIQYSNRLIKFTDEKIKKYQSEMESINVRIEDIKSNMDMLEKMKQRIDPNKTLKENLEIILNNEVRV